MQEQNNSFPKTSASSSAMSDRDFLTDCLTSEKYMTQSYATALHEMSHHALYKDIHSLFTKTEEYQRKLYNLMFEKGWYSYKAANPQNIQEVSTQFTKYQNEQFPDSQPIQ